MACKLFLGNFFKSFWLLRGNYVNQQIAYKMFHCFFQTYIVRCKKK